MIDRKTTARNVAIVLLIAAVVEFVPGGGRAANTFSAVLSVLFLAGLTYMGVRLYRERRVDVYGLGDRHRALLYGVLAIGVLTAGAKERMWQSGFGEFVWFVLVGLVAYALFAIYRYARSY